MVLALLFGACAGPQNDDKETGGDTASDTAGPPDEDADGYTADADPAVNPGTEEVPWDDVDNDCAGGDDRTWLDIVANGAVTCGLDASGAARCWGDAEARSMDDRPGPYTQLAGGTDFVCGLDVSGVATCWGDGAPTLSTEPFTTLDGMGTGACGVRVDASVECSFDLSPDGPVVAGPYTSATAGVRYACALDAAGAMACWNGGIEGPSDNGQAVAQEGTFLAVDAGTQHTCALTSAGALTCWGLSLDGRTEPPAGAYTALSVGNEHGCAIDAAGALTCWGSDAYGQSAAPDGTFVMVSAGGNVSCGILADGSAVCWGSNMDNQLQVPE